MVRQYTNAKDSGKIGKNYELAVKFILNRPTVLGKNNETDIRNFNHHNWEIKTGAGELKSAEGKTYCKGSSMVIYAPVVHESDNAWQMIKKTEAFVMEKETFISILNECGLIREKVSTDGTLKTTIQTFWNNSKNAPHGKKYYTLMDRLYEGCDNGTVTPFDEYIAEFVERVKNK